MKTEVLWTRVSRQLAEDLRKVASAKQMTVSELIRYLLQKFVDEQKQTNPQIFQVKLAYNFKNAEELIRCLLGRCRISNTEIWQDAEKEDVWYFDGKRGKTPVHGQVYIRSDKVEILWWNTKTWADGDPPHHWWTYSQEDLTLLRKEGTKD